jgi:hypothetical protein
MFPWFRRNQIINAKICDLASYVHNYGLMNILTEKYYIYNNLVANLDMTKSQLKSLNFKNLSREIQIFNLDTLDNHDKFQ